MKALLMKDWKLLKGQKQFFMVVGFIALVFLMTSENPSFVISYVTVMFTVFTISTVQYDEYEKGMSYLFTLPVNRKEYAAEKYIFGVICAVASGCIMAAASCVIAILRGLEVDLEIILIADVSAVLIGILFMAFAVPVQLKFGSEKSRIAWMATFMVVFILVLVGSKLVEILDLNVSNLLGWVDEVSMGVVAGAAFGICAVLTVLSLLLSIWFLEKREF